MSDEPGPLEHFLIVVLRNNSDPIYIGQASREAALSSVRFIAELLKKSPADRAYCWCPSQSGMVTTINAEGIEAHETQVPIAAIDPREVVSVQVASRNGEAWRGP